MADWSELPSELLEFISNLTNTSSDIRRFRSVCCSWRSSVTVKPITTFVPPNIKLLSLSSQTAPSFELRLVKQTTFLLSLSSDPNSSCWVIKTEEHKPGVFSLISPFSKKNFIKHFGYNILDLTNVNTFEIVQEYVVRNASGNDHMSSYDNIEQERVAFAFAGDESFVLLSTHNSTGKLLMHRSGFQEWTFLDDFALGYDDGGDFAYDWSMRYVDVVSYEGKFYAVTDSGRTAAITFGDDMSVEVNLMMKSIIGGDKKCLVKSADDLLLVDLYTCSVDESIEINAIDVFKLDTEEKRWVLLRSLGGRSIFLSNDSSFSTESVHGVKENCIYFSFKNLGRDALEKKDGNLDANGDLNDEDEVESSEIGVFEYDKGSFGSLEENSENSKLFCWPPPSWVNFLK